jgi:hypothetical protein
VKYYYSQVDKDNLSWFSKDLTVQSLTEVNLSEGHLRGLNPFTLSFTYPISAIAGRNRSGKSTIITMAACAFHNSKSGFKLPERNLPYYTFSDFFVQSSEEVPPEGVKIKYRIMHNHWTKSPRAPDGTGNLYQIREKHKGGKWNNYDRRVERNVVFFGVQRVVPPVERSVARSYRARFSEQTSVKWEADVQSSVGRILGANYDGFKMNTYGKYRLPVVGSDGVRYSGFNMGAGENALFGIFSTIHESPIGTLLVIDEIELGLHAQAQKRLVNELKEACKQRHIQVVCTTHSATILRALPPEARFYVENVPGKTNVIPGVSPDYAEGRLSGEHSKELDIYVEDGVARDLLIANMGSGLRRRARLIPIGSATAVIRHLAAIRKDPRTSECVAILDGDQKSQLASLNSNFISALEKYEDKNEELNWLSERLFFLPGDTWPERWMIDMMLENNLDGLAEDLGSTRAELGSCLIQAKAAGKHNEIFQLATDLCLDTENVLRTVSRRIVTIKPESFKSINAMLNKYFP